MYSGMYDNPYSSYGNDGVQNNTTNFTASTTFNNINNDDQASSPLNNNATRSIVPLTVKLIKQTIQSSDATHTYYGSEVRSICICGQVRGELKNQLMTFTIHDGTGEITGKIYVSQNNSDITSIQSGYCRIIGNLSTTASSLSINIHHIQPINSVDEVLHHFFNVIIANHYFKTHGSSNPSVNAPIQSTPSDFSNTIEMFITRELQQLLNQYPGGVHINTLLSTLSTYGISREQLKMTLADMERDSKVYLSDVDTYVLIS